MLETRASLAQRSADMLLVARSHEANAKRELAQREKAEAERTARAARGAVLALQRQEMDAAEMR